MSPLNLLTYRSLSQENAKQNNGRVYSLVCKSTIVDEPVTVTLVFDFYTVPIFSILESVEEWIILRVYKRETDRRF